MKKKSLFKEIYKRNLSLFVVLTMATLCVISTIFYLLQTENQIRYNKGILASYSKALESDLEYGNLLRVRLLLDTLRKESDFNYIKLEDVTAGTSPIITPFIHDEDFVKLSTLKSIQVGIVNYQKSLNWKITGYYSPQSKANLVIMVIATAFLLTLYYVLVSLNNLKLVSRDYEYFQNFLANKNNKNQLSKLLNAESSNEAHHLLEEIVDKIKENEELVSQKARYEIEEQKFQLNRQVAHDLRSPLAALKLVSKYFSDSKNDHMDILNMSIQRIDGVCSELLVNSNDAPNALFPAYYFFEQKVREAKFRFQNIASIDLINSKQNLSDICFLSLDQNKLSRTFDNLVNNAVEACKNHSPLVTIELKVENGILVINITDNGSGIPEEIQSSIFEENFTHGKDAGNGIGLSFVKSFLVSNSGDISIRYSSPKGTCFKLSLPLANKPNWAISQHKLSDYHTVVVLDDDPAITSVWSSLIESSGFQHSKFKLFNKLDDFYDFMEAKPSFNSLFFLDLNIGNESVNGLDLIKEYKISSSSILVTTEAESSSVQESSTRIGNGLLSKNYLEFYFRDGLISHLTTSSPSHIQEKELSKQL